MGAVERLELMAFAVIVGMLVGAAALIVVYLLI